MNSGDARQRMHTGQLYLFTDELAQEQREALEKLYDYNLTRPSETERRQALLKEMTVERCVGKTVRSNRLFMPTGQENLHTLGMTSM